MISSNLISEIAKKEGISWAIVEKDYFLTLVLDGISNNELLRQNLVFKGGTALRKIYFRHYRYSEDLDFTLKSSFKEKEVINALNLVFAYLKKEHNAEFKLKSIYDKKWFSDIKIQFTGIKNFKNSITIDLVSDEILVDGVEGKLIFNPYYNKNFTLFVYSLEEILAEKLRSLLQRTRVRDYYDVWYILTHTKIQLNMKKVKEIFLQKVEYKKLTFTGKQQFIDQDKIEQIRAYYAQQLGDQIKNLLPFDAFIEELKEAINRLQF